MKSITVYFIYFIIIKYKTVAYKATAIVFYVYVVKKYTLKIYVLIFTTELNYSKTYSIL